MLYNIYILSKLLFIHFHQLIDRLPQNKHTLPHIKLGLLCSLAQNIVKNETMTMAV